MAALAFAATTLGAIGLGLPGVASAQAVIPQGPSEAGSATLTTFVHGRPIGSEQVTITRTPEGWTIVSTGRMSPPIDATVRRIEVRYTADWRPRAFMLDGAARGVTQSIRTVIDGNQAKSNIDTGGQKNERTDTIDPNAVVVLPTTFFAPFEAIAARLPNAAPGTTIPAFGVPAIPFTIQVGESSRQQIQTTARMIAARRTRVTLAFPNAAIVADVWNDEGGRLLRLSVPEQSLEVVREDIAAVSSRSVPISRPNDEPVQVPSNGFVLAGTVSKPEQAGAAKLPAVVLVGGSGPTDRDSLVFGIPILGQIANALAEAGFIVLRYDKRGVGQSGGRPESAGLIDYAEDVRAAIKYLAGRKDVDPKRLAVAGHSEGGTVALIAASREKRVAAVALLATPGTTGADLVLAQQRHLLDRTKLSADEKQAKIDLQKRIHDAVLTGKGVDQLPVEVRRAAENIEFQTLLGADPGRILQEVRQPLLIVQGDLDTQVEPANADRLEALARKRKKAAAVDVVHVPGTNHLLVPATTGEVDEYGTLTDRTVVPAVTQALVSWLKKTL